MVTLANIYNVSLIMHKMQQCFIPLQYKLQATVTKLTRASIALELL